MRKEECGMNKKYLPAIIFIGLAFVVLLVACIPFEGSLDEVRKKAGDGKGEPVTATLVRIEITSPPDKVSYIIGENLNLSGLVVTAFYNDETSKPVIGYTYSGFDSLTAGIKTVTVTFEGCEATFPVTVAPPEKILTKIEISSLPSKTTYVIGESLSLSGLVVTAFYSDESSTPVVGYTYSGFDSATAGSKTITITYEGKTAVFTVTVAAPVKTLTGIDIFSMPSKTTYAIGETLNLSNLVVRAIYSDFTFEPITGYTTSSLNSNTGGSKEITVSYSGMTTSFFVTVNARTFTVTFDRNGGTTDASPSSRQATEAIPAPTIGMPTTAPTRTGGYNLVFDGWYKEPGTINPWNFSTDTVTGNITLYAKWRPYNIGETGPGGGKIFYRASGGFTVEGYTGSPGTFAAYIAYYFEVAPSIFSGGPAWMNDIEWINVTTFTATSNPLATKIGNGRKDTQYIVATANASGQSDRAAQLCVAATYGGKNDWFLPSLGELNQLYINRSSVGSIVNYGDYWSSCQYDNIYTWCMNCYSGNQLYQQRNNAGTAVAVRAF